LEKFEPGENGEVVKYHVNLNGRQSSCECADFLRWGMTLARGAGASTSRGSKPSLTRAASPARPPRRSRRARPNETDRRRGAKKRLLPARLPAGPRSPPPGRDGRTPGAAGFFPKGVYHAGDLVHPLRRSGGR
jgi:hypothetical protein